MGIFSAHQTEVVEIQIYGITEALALLKQGRAHDAREVLEEALSQSVACSQRFYAKNRHFAKKPLK